MNNYPSWALVEVGECPSCLNGQFLFTHSLANLGFYAQYGYVDVHGKPYVACLACHRRALRNNSENIPDEEYQHLRDSMPTITAEMYPIMAETPLCYACGHPASSLHPLVEAVRQDDRTIIVQVHEVCRRGTSCCNRFIVSGGYNWNSYIDGSLRPESHHYVTILDFEGGGKCQSCVDDILEEREQTIDDYFVCTWCQCYWDNDCRDIIDGEDYCQRCIDRNRYYCDNCDSAYWSGDDHDCDDDEGDGVIHDYGYKPRPYFFPPKERAPDNRLYFGIELEVESVRGERIDCAHHVQDSLGERVYLKYDGSLTNGFEIVTHPHTLEAFRKDFAFEKFASFRKLGLRSWDTSTCGLHVHVSRDAFGVPYDSRTDNYSEHIASRQRHELRFIKLVYDNEVQVSKLAGRKSGYANFGDKGNLLRKVREQGFDRHAAVNTENNNTLEVRVFKGSLRPERVLGAIEFVHAGVEYTRNLKVNGKNSALSWVAFCGYVHANQEQYSNLYTLMLKSFRDERDVETIDD